MTYLSLGEAAKAAGIAKGTISKSLKSGRLSYVSKTPAGYQIDPAELFRVFPQKPGQPTKNERLETPSETVEMAVLRVRLEAAERRAADLAKQLDQAHEEKLRLMTLLPSPDPAPLPPRRGRLARWFG